MSADYSKYTTSKNFTGLDPQWRKDVEHDVSHGKFKKFTSANSCAKQFVIYVIDKHGFTPKVESLGCSVHRISIGA